MAANDKKKRFSQFHVGGKYPTLAANLHFLAPAFLGLSLAEGTIDEPAEVSGFKLPCGAILHVLCGTTARQPAGLVLLGSAGF